MKKTVLFYLWGMLFFSCANPPRNEVKTKAKFTDTLRTNQPISIDTNSYYLEESKISSYEWQVPLEPTNQKFSPKVLITWDEEGELPSRIDSLPIYEKLEDKLKNKTFINNAN